MCAPGVSGSSVEWDRPEEGGRGGVVRFYKSQCKSRDKYYLLFEEKALEVPTVQRGKVQVCLEHKLGLVQRKRCQRSDRRALLDRRANTGLAGPRKERASSARASRQQSATEGTHKESGEQASCHFQSFPSGFKWLNSITFTRKRSRDFL